MDSTDSTDITDTAPGATASLHLLPLADVGRNHPVADIFAAGTPLLIPLGAGLVTGVRERSPGHDPTGRSLTTDDLVARDTTVGGLWADAALTMLATLGHLTSVHGTALRQRHLGHGVREVGVIDVPFPAAGLIAHPLLIRPTVRILQDTPRVAVTGTGRLLILDADAPPLNDIVGDEVCSPVLTLTDSALLR